MAVNIPVTSKPRIVIIGAGFAGIELAKALASADVRELVSRDNNNIHVFFLGRFFRHGWFGWNPFFLTFFGFSSVISRSQHFVSLQVRAISNSGII